MTCGRPRTGPNTQHTLLWTGCATDPFGASKDPGGLVPPVLLRFGPCLGPVRVTPCPKPKVNRIPGMPEWQFRGDFPHCAIPRFQSFSTLQKCPKCRRNINFWPILGCFGPCWPTPMVQSKSKNDLFQNDPDGTQPPPLHPC